MERLSIYLKNADDWDSIDGEMSFYNKHYCMTNGVDAIIDEDTFLAVQEEKKRRSNYDEDEFGRHRRKTRYSSKKVWNK